MYVCNYMIHNHRCYHEKASHCKEKKPKQISKKDINQGQNVKVKTKQTQNKTKTTKTKK